MKRGKGVAWGFCRFVTFACSLLVSPRDVVCLFSPFAISLIHILFNSMKGYSWSACRDC